MGTPSSPWLLQPLGTARGDHVQRQKAPDVVHPAEVPGYPAVKHGMGDQVLQVRQLSQIGMVLLCEFPVFGKTNLVCGDCIRFSRLTAVL